MIRTLLALLVSVALLLPQGFARVDLWRCSMDGEIHAAPCCDDAVSTGPIIRDTCCRLQAAGAERAVPPSLTPPPAPAVVAVAEPTYTVVPARAARPADTRAWAVAPPATGPPIWLEVRSLRL